MNELITVNYDNDRPTVLGRDLHEKLEINTKYTDWFKRMCEYGFTENVDFVTRFSNLGSENQHGGQNKIDHQLTLDMAKQICMIQRTDEGRRYREYFLEIERKWNDPVTSMARSLVYANRQLASVTGQLEAANRQIEADRPKVIFADAVSAADTSILVGDLSKILRQNGVTKLNLKSGVKTMGQNNLFEWLRDNEYLIKQGSSKNMPTQTSAERGLIQIKESTKAEPNGSIRIMKTPMITGKGQQYFINLFLKAKEKNV